MNEVKIERVKVNLVDITERLRSQKRMTEIEFSKYCNLSDSSYSKFKKSGSGNTKTVLNIMEACKGMMLIQMSNGEIYKIK